MVLMIDGRKVFDRDDHERFEEAIRLCELHGVKVARSNPCFEIWLILHHAEYDKSSGRKDVQKHLQKLHPNYDRYGSKQVDAHALLQHIDKAEKHAERQLKRRAKEGKDFGCPSTTVHHLTMAIRERDKTAK